jgi:peptidylprolyl isomerase
MKNTVFILLIAASAAAASAQTPAKQTAPTATATVATKPVTKATSTTKPASTAQKSTASSNAVKLPPGVPPVKAALQTAFSLRYQEIKIGTGAEAETNKIYKIHYTGWVAADGRKFDSSYDHRTAVLDKDKKPVLDADGKPQMGDPQPYSFIQGIGRMIPGIDEGFYGMKIGGKRRIFVPWQMAYGAKGRPVTDPKAANYPGIPPMADLIFDVELLEVTDLPAAATRPAASAAPNSTARPAGSVFGRAPQSGTTAAPGQPGTAATPAQPGAAATPTPAAAPAAPPSTTAPASQAQPAAPAPPPSN